MAATPQAQAAPSAESTPAADATLARLLPGIDGANIMDIEEAPSDTKRPLWGTSLATCSQSPWNFVLVGWLLAFMSLGVGGVAKSAQLSLVTADGRPLQQAALVGAAAPGAVLLQPDAVQTAPAPTVPAPLQSLAAAARLDPVAMPLPGGQQSLALPPLGRVPLAVPEAGASWQSRTVDSTAAAAPSPHAGLVGSPAAATTAGVPAQTIQRTRTGPRLLLVSQPFVF